MGMPETSLNTNASPEPWLLLRFDANYCLYLKRDADGKLVVDALGKTGDPAPESGRFLTKFDTDESCISIYCEVEGSTAKKEAALSLDALKQAVDAGCCSHDGSIKPAAASWTSRSCTEFIAQLPQMVAFIA